MAKTNKVKTDSRKIGRILTFALLTLALLVGLIFSSIKVNMNMTYGSEYNGAYQASVQVIQNKTQDNDKPSLEKIAGSLQDKLAPFSDKSISITKQGKDHLNVMVGKEDYQNSEDYLRSQIESNGGMFILEANEPTDVSDNTTATFTDFMTDSNVIKAVGSSNTNGSSNAKLSSSDLFTGDVSSTTLSDGSGRKPFVQIGLAQSSDKTTTKFAQALNSFTSTDANGQKKQNAPNLFFISDLEEMIDTLRNLYQVRSNDDNLINTYYNEIIVPLQSFVSSSSVDANEKSILTDMFGGTVSSQLPGSKIQTQKKISLLEQSFSAGTISLGDKNNANTQISGINSLDSLKAVLKAFTPNTSERPTNYYLYNSGDSSDDLNSKIDPWLHPNTSSSLTKKDVFGWITDAFIGNILLDKNAEANAINSGNPGVPNLNTKLTDVAPQLKDYFLYRGTVNPSTSSTDTTNVSSVVAKGVSFIVDNGPSMQASGSVKVKNAFYLSTDNLTSAKKAVASIQQNGLGITYLVESVTNVNPYITSVLYVISLVFLSIIALLLAIYVLFVYRLLGLFTLIIAATSVAITLLAAVGFGIAMGPQVICALFLIIALVLDTNFILFEGFKRNYYKEKHGILSSFKIGNKETLSMAIDAILVAFIPTIVLFWAGSGTPKSFATLAIVGIALAVIAGLIIGRFIYYFILKAKFVQDSPWMLPIDTDYSSITALRDEYFIKKYTHYLEKHEGKDNYSSKELIKINAYKDELKARNALYHSHLFQQSQNTAKKDEKTISRINRNSQLLDKLKSLIIKTFRMKRPVEHASIRMLDARIQDNNFLMNLENQAEISEYEDDQKTVVSKLNDKGNIVRKNRFIGKGTAIVIGIVLVIGIISAIIGGVLGANWNVGTGYGQEYVVYGTNVTDTYQKVDVLKTNDSWASARIRTKLQQIDDYYAADMKAAQESDNGKGNDAQNRVFAYELNDFLKYVNDNDAYTDFGQSNYTKRINLKDAEFSVIGNYEHVGENGQKLNKDFVAVKIDSTSVDKDSRTQYKRFLSFLQKNSWPIKDPENNDLDNGGLFGYDISPYTMTKQIKEIAIVLGITLAGLLIYILIRFKWTYYVALALGLVLTIGITIALIIVFRIPVSAELLSGMVFVLTFAITSMILVLGKGKAQLNLEEKTNIDKNFNGEIKIAADIRRKKAKAKSVYQPLKKDINKIKKQLRKVKKDYKKSLSTLDEINELKQELDRLKQEFKKIKKVEMNAYKDYKDSAKVKQNEEQRKNWFFKSLFATLINYSVWRMAILGVFYLLVGIILAVTLPSIFGMGLTIIIGLISGAVITLFIVVPVWVYFEKRRIRYVYGRKRYIESLKVSHEEEIVKGIND